MVGQTDSESRVKGFGIGLESGLESFGRDRSASPHPVMPHQQHFSTKFLQMPGKTEAGEIEEGPIEPVNLDPYM